MYRIYENLAMRKSYFLSVICCCMLLFMPPFSEADLIDRGGGLIYDTALDITWLQDANYVETTDYDDFLYGSNYHGQLTWQDAKSWAENLNYYDPVRNVYWDDWRLPRILPINPPSYDLTWSYEGTTDRGFNILSPNSELSYLYYVSLGNLGAMSIDGQRPQPGWGLHEVDAFRNIAITYWSESEFIPGEEVAYFGIQNGEQASQNITVGRAFKYAWAVRDGDVLPPDTDGDGVADSVDACTKTIIPESVPAVRLNTGHWALTDSDNDFDTMSPVNREAIRSYDLTDTAGCSCEQIIAALGLGEGHNKFGCSIGAMDEWIALPK